jgi:hypothetical protein
MRIASQQPISYDVNRAVRSAKRRRKVARKSRRLVHEATVGVELLVHASHDDLRLQERVRVREYKRLA